MKKILIITNKFPFGKDETFLETELKFLLKSNLNVTIFSQNTDSESRKIDPSVKVKSPKKHYVNPFLFLKHLPLLFSEIGRNFGSVFKFKVMFRAYIESISLFKNMEEIVTEIDKNQNVLIYSYWHDNSTLAAVLLKRKYSNISAVTRVHGGDLYSERSQGNYLPFRNPVYNAIEHVYCISDNGRTYLSEKYPKLSDKFSCAYLGTTNELEYHSFEENPNSLISCSHINPVKRLDLLIKALSELDRSCRWEHFGYGFEYNEKPIFELVDEILADSIIEYTFHGQVPNDEIAERMIKGKFSFLINLSESEGLPVAMMEAMSCGIPCIGTNVGGVAEIINDGVNGFLLSANPTMAEVRAVIYRCLDMSVDQLNTMRESAYKTWESKFNADVNYTLFAKMLSAY